MLERWFGAKRWLWNTALEIRSAAYRECGLRLTGNDLSRWLTLWKRTTGHEWLANIPATCLTQCLRDQDRAFANFFAKRAKYPRFRRRGTLRSLRFQDVGSPWSRGALRLPKLGRVKLAEALPETARPDMVTLWRDGADRYFVSFAVEVDSAPLASTGRSIGVDPGLKHLAILSTGEKVENPGAITPGCATCASSSGHCRARPRAAGAVRARGCASPARSTMRRSASSAASSAPVTGVTCAPMGKVHARGQPRRRCPRVKREADH